jgi:hypothetical protein
LEKRVTHLDANHLKQMNTLLERTDEFIEFFQHTEAKMIQWRHEITQQAAIQKEHLSELKQKLDSIQSFIATSGVDGIRTVAEETLSQSDAYLHSLKNTEQQLLRQIHSHRAELTRITQHAITRITQQTKQAVIALDEKTSLSLTHPHPTAMNDEQMATDAQQMARVDTYATHRAHVPLDGVCSQHPQTRPKFTEWKPLVFALATSLLTAVVFGLYTTDEYPWEMHQHAMNERGAGKVLMNAWPSLSNEEQRKILNRMP